MVMQPLGQAEAHAVQPVQELEWHNIDFLPHLLPLRTVRSFLSIRSPRAKGLENVLQ